MEHIICSFKQFLVSLVAHLCLSLSQFAISAKWMKLFSAVCAHPLYLSVCCSIKLHRINFSWNDDIHLSQILRPCLWWTKWFSEFPQLNIQTNSNCTQTALSHQPIVHTSDVIHNHTTLFHNYMLWLYYGIFIFCLKTTRHEWLVKHWINAIYLEVQYTLYVRTHSMSTFTMRGLFWQIFIYSICFQ